MSKKIIKEILKLNQLPLYKDRAEFIDKMTTYLCSRLQLKSLEFVSAQKLSSEESLSKEDKPRLKTSDGALQEWFVSLKDPVLGQGCLCIKVSRPRSFMRKPEKMKLFVLLLRDYWQRHLDFFASREDFRSENTSKNSDFLIFKADQLPENIQLEAMIETLEKDILREALQRTGGVKISAARQLGITERMMGYKIKKYGL